MKCYVQTCDNRVTCLTFDPLCKDDSYVEVEVPDDLVEPIEVFEGKHYKINGNLFDYRVETGSLVYTGEGTKKVEEERNRQLLNFQQREQVVQFAKYKVSQTNFEQSTSDEVVRFKDLWPDWEPNTEYGFQQPLKWKGKYYRTSKALISSPTYPPDTAGESEYYPIEVADDGVIVYRTCHGEYDSVRVGEKRHYPDASGPVYESLVDKNAYSPDVKPDDWKLVE